MNKLFWVARREFLATVATKAFIFGIFFPIIAMGLVIALMPVLMNKAAPKVSGHIAVIDQSEKVGARLQDAFSKEKMTERLKARFDQMQKQVPVSVGGAADQASAAIVQMLPDLEVRVLPQNASVDGVKEEILKTKDMLKEDNGRAACLALVIVPPGSVTPDEKGEFVAPELFVSPKLDAEVQEDFERQIGRAVVDARVAARGMDVKDVRELTRAPDIDAKTVTAEGDKESNVAAKMLVPGAFMILLWISVFTCGQGLLTSTIEEKSNRVMEVLLSAVSPMQLMVGKILGQMGVGVVILVVYCGLGMGGLVLASMMHILDPMLLIYLAVFFVLAFFMIASMMAAIGSAVSDLREAQSLMAPAMIVLMIPMMLWMPIMRNPNSMFAQICSFVPPIGPFVMTLRVAGSEKVPMWQIPGSILAGAVGAVVFAWAAAKIFRIGVLMYGKPPNVKTLLRWIRMA